MKLICIFICILFYRRNAVYNLSMPTMVENKVKENGPAKEIWVVCEGWGGIDGDPIWIIPSSCCFFSI